MNDAANRFKLSQKKCLVVPYAVLKTVASDHRLDMDARHGIMPQEKIILFAGTLDYLPNAEAVANIYQCLVPELEKQPQLFKILICGRLKEKAFQYLKSYTHPRVLFVGEVEDIYPYFEAADVFIDPVLYHGGMQTKILDALGRHCTVVAFEKALQGLNVTLALRKIISVSNADWKGFAAAIQSAWTRKEETPAAFFEYYDWKRIVANAYGKMKVFQNPITSR